MRMRVTFATDESVKYIGPPRPGARLGARHSSRRTAALLQPGFSSPTAHPVRAALPVGFTGAAEVVDVYLYEELGPAEFLSRLEPALPRGIRPAVAAQVPNERPSLQSQVCGATYEVEVETDEGDAAFSSRLEAFLAKSSAWRERRRGDRLARYDLRPLVLSLRYRGACDLGQAFTAEMRCEPGATGRPDELLAEIGLEVAVRRIERLRLAFAEA